MTAETTYSDDVYKQIKVQVLIFESPTWSYILLAIYFVL